MQLQRRLNTGIPLRQADRHHDAKEQATKTTQANKNQGFALLPAASVGGILNYTKAEHSSKIYKSGVRSSAHQ
jgi:hypothetical protein